MEKTQHPNADRRCVNCKYYDTVTNLQNQSQTTLCRIEPPRMLAQVLPMQGPNGQTIPQWIQIAAWPVVAPNDWCGRFSKQLHSVDTRTPEQRLADAAKG